jgi:hypothetical protein
VPARRFDGGMTKAENRAAAKAYRQEKMRAMDERIRAARVNADLGELDRLRRYLIRERTAGHTQPLIEAIDDSAEQLTDRTALHAKVSPYRMTWSRAFDEPIALRRKLVTLLDAGEYITALPKKEHEAAEWRAAIEALLLVVDRGGPTMLARIGGMRAPNRHYVPDFNPSGKEPHWGRHKLRRDE